MAGNRPKARKGADKFEFFWQSVSPFSQWHLTPFVLDGHTYTCAEHYMMHQKALLFGDDSSATEILECPDPRKQKSLGRGVKNFDEDTWKRERVEIVKRGSRGKFSQNPELRRSLLSTHPRLLVEASPHDRIWGIGLKAEDPKAWNKATWRGQNLLGYALTEVRQEMMAAESGNRAEKETLHCSTGTPLQGSRNPRKHGSHYKIHRTTAPAVLPMSL